METLPECVRQYFDGWNRRDADAVLAALAPKLKAIAKSGYDEQIFIRGDKGIDYGTVMRVMGRVKSAGFTKVSLVTESEGS